jgi:putative spermidine/putrescine transport system ATP-binding protein
MADRISVMSQGRILQVASPRELYERPANPEVAAFVGQANLWPGTVAGHDIVDTTLGRIATDPHDYPAGARVTVMVRPEKIRLGPAPNNLNTFAGEVRLDRFLGSVRQFDFSVSGGIIIGETADLSQITTVHIPRSSVSLLPS